MLPTRWTAVLRRWAPWVALWVFLLGDVALGATPIDRSTPRQTVSGFLRAVDADDLGSAKKYLDRRKTPPKGVSWNEVIDRLESALRQRMVLDLDEISDVPEGESEDGAGYERIGMLGDAEGGTPVTLERQTRDGEQVWLFSSETLHRLPDVHEPSGSVSALVEFVPERWRTDPVAGLWPWQWLGLAIAVLLALPFGYVLGRVLWTIVGRIATTTPSNWDDEVVAQTASGVRFTMAWATFAIVVENLALPAGIQRWVDIGVQTPLILAAGWLTRKVVLAVTSVYLDQAMDDAALNARGLRTQINILRRLSTVAIVLISASLVLMQFEVVRNVGLSLLASAGVAGVALGFAAKESLANVIAGLQLSISQTIRLGDTVVIEGQWAKVEEIALTYVRFQLNDDRRLVVPVARVLGNPFENWSAAGDGLIGLVEIAVDPTADVERIRQELRRLAEAHPAHDGRECVLQLVDANEHRALLRARVSSRDLSETFAMRCDLREQLLAFLREHEGGRHLPRRRYERLQTHAANGEAQSDEGPEIGDEG